MEPNKDKQSAQPPQREGPGPGPDDTKVIRVHTAEGTVYARIMEPMTFPFEAYMFIEAIDVPAGLTQQEAVNHFRAQGWTVEQDHGTDFDNPEWGP